MVTMRTLPKAAEEIKAKDPGACISVYTLRRWVRSGQLATVKVGKNYLVSMETLDAFLNGSTYGDN